MQRLTTRRVDDLDVRGYWESVHTASTGLAAVGYGGLGEPFNRWMYRVRRDVFLSTVPPHLGDSAALDVLDIGSGSGFYLDLWQELGVGSVIGSDLTEAAVGRLRGQYPDLDLLRLDVGGDPGALPARTFDVVSAFDVLFHIVDDARYARAFENLATLVKPGGLLVFSENFLRNQVERVDSVQKNRSDAEIRALLAANGFEPLDHRRMFVLMNYPADGGGLVHRGAWILLTRAITQWNELGHVVGAALYPIERRLVARPGDGPGTELMICRRTAS